MGHYKYIHESIYQNKETISMIINRKNSPNYDYNQQKTKLKYLVIHSNVPTETFLLFTVATTPDPGSSRNVSSVTCKFCLKNKLAVINFTTKR
jgi:hypothetical protein